ncbi:MAG TPA: peptide deformylase [Sedimentibacter sp.]|jgi:peptide deformylase|nr:peptide deformylase [Sedimentibacter sp.]NLA13471.1 peptide deformylase [Tissierellia bacterium]HAS92741.1 peptide deformylase [Clostridiales bacterium]HOA19656.1 peptide deformylase [Sedimentibacter sp.]HOG62145.1 peptide deformylase [Sedimentibacter sp.]
MALRNLRYEGDEILRKKSREVPLVDDRIRMLMEDMVETMYKYDGVGLAAPQVGILKRVIVIDVEDGKVYKMANPNIINESGEQSAQEGCLSVPEKKGIVSRPMKVIVEYTDENNETVKLEAEGLLARAICHEIDHLNGVLFIDRVTDDVIEE